MQVIGRYALCDELAHGGMATVHLGRLLGPAGFSRTVAIKRLHPHLAKDPEFVTMLLDEARLTGRIQHPKVVSTLDMVASDGELFIVMDYIHGETLGKLLRASSKAQKRMPPAIAAAILIDTLEGLHAAHEVKGERGEPLGLVHRDFTPQNIMVRKDGTGLVVDFGVAKAAGRFQTTEEGKIKGKIPYMAPEQIRAAGVSRRTDVYAAGVVLWETLVGERAFGGTNEGEVLEKILFSKLAAPGTKVADLPKALDEVVLRALDRDPEKRFASAAEMALAIERAIDPARPSKVAAWMEEIVGESLSAQAAKLAEVETIDTGPEARQLETPGKIDPTRFDIARPGPKLTDSEIRRSMPDGAEASSPTAESGGGDPTKIAALAPRPQASPVGSAVSEPTTVAGASSVISRRSGRERESKQRGALFWILGVASLTVIAFLLMRDRLGWIGAQSRDGNGPAPTMTTAPAMMTATATAMTTAPATMTATATAMTTATTTSTAAPAASPASHGGRRPQPVGVPMAAPSAPSTATPEMCRFVDAQGTVRYRRCEK